MAEIPDKLYYKVAEVCRYTDTQPYVLRFWESEFPQLAAQKNRSGQRVYSREDLDLILRIKNLLYEKEYTIAGVRELLDRERPGTSASGPAPTAVHEDWTDVLPDEEKSRGGNGGDSYRASYESARAEIEVLRRRLSETEEKLREAEAALAASEHARQLGKERSERVALRLEVLLRSLSAREKRAT